MINYRTFVLLIQFFRQFENDSHFGNLSIDILLGTYYIINVRIVSKKTLKDYYSKHKETKSQLEAWIHDVKNSNWSKQIEVKEKYGKASIIGGDKVVFNIKRNKYRLVTKINYRMKIVYIKFIGTHKEYDKINVEDL